MDNEYLYHLTFTFFKFTLKNFIFLEMMSDTMVSSSIFHFIIIITIITYWEIRSPKNQTKHISFQGAYQGKHIFSKFSIKGKKRGEDCKVMSKKAQKTPPKSNSNGSCY